MLRTIIVMHPLLPSNNGNDNKFEAFVTNGQELATAITNHFAVLRANEKSLSSSEYNCMLEDYTTKLRMKSDPSLSLRFQYENFKFTDNLPEGADKIALLFNQLKSSSGFDEEDEKIKEIIKSYLLTKVKQEPVVPKKVDYDEDDEECDDEDDGDYVPPVKSTIDLSNCF